MDPKEVRDSARKTFNAFRNTIPILLGILLLIALAIKGIPPEFYSSLFTGNVLLDSVIGAVFGSIAAGNPINSYVIGGELMMRGVSMFAIISFMVAWVTVGVIQFPAESMLLGRRFAIVRNLTSFALCIVISLVTVLTLGVLG